MSVGEAGRLDTLDAGEMSDEYADTPIDYEAGEPESEEQEDEDAYMSEDDDDEVDELVDEVDESEVVPETNRRSRRAPLRITLKRKNAKETPSGRRSARASKRTARARQMDDAAPRAADEDEGEEEEDEEMEDDELEGNDSDEVSTTTGEVPMTARQLARANRARGLLTEELVELPMGMLCTLITESSKKKKLSETELALRRSETARRRRNQSERKLEDDKIETINRLLKKQAGKVRGKDKGDNEGADEADHPRKPRDLKANYPQPMFRYINRADQSLLAVPLGPPFVGAESDTQAEGLYDATLRCAFNMSREAWAPRVTSS